MFRPGRDKAWLFFFQLGGRRRGTGLQGVTGLVGGVAFGLFGVLE